MGKQARFYMTQEDERAFLTTLRRERGPIVVVLNTFKEELDVVAELKPVNAFNTDMSIIRVADVNRLVSHFVETQGESYIDVMNSEVIQFSRCEMKHSCYGTMPDWLASGRLWFDERTMTGRKSEEFCAWANKLFAWFRRHYRRTEDRSDFVGPEAAELSARGLLKLGPSKEGIPRDVAKKILGLE